MITDRLMRNTRLVLNYVLPQQLERQWENSWVSSLPRSSFRWIYVKPWTGFLFLHWHKIQRLAEANQSLLKSLLFKHDARWPDWSIPITWLTMKVSKQDTQIDFWLKTRIDFYTKTRNKAVKIKREEMQVMSVNGQKSDAGIRNITYFRYISNLNWTAIHNVSQCNMQ